MRNEINAGKDHGGRGQEVRLPLATGAWPSLRADFPMTESAWAQMMAVLEVMKPGLVRPDPVENPDADDAAMDPGGESREER